jgi:hypothetical protein
MKMFLQVSLNIFNEKLKNKFMNWYLVNVQLLDAYHIGGLLKSVS